MLRYALSDDTYLRLAPLLPGKVGDRGRSARDNRLFLDAIHFMAHNGGPWRGLPERFGPWNSVFRRFDRWGKNGNGSGSTTRCKIPTWTGCCST